MRACISDEADGTTVVENHGGSSSPYGLGRDKEEWEWSCAETSPHSLVLQRVGLGTVAWRVVQGPGVRSACDWAPPSPDSETGRGPSSHWNSGSDAGECLRTSAV